MCYDDADGTVGTAGSRPGIAEPPGLQPPPAGGHRPRGAVRLHPGPVLHAVRHAGADAGPGHGQCDADRRRGGVDLAGKLIVGARPEHPAATSAPSATAPAVGRGRPPSAAAPGPQHSLSDPTSPWVIVNKHRPLSPATFVPPDLVRPAVRLATSGEAALLNSTTAAAAERMFAAAAADGVIITLASGYRSFATQRATYGSYVNSRGQAEADTASARPGYSEHQTGWAFDIGDGSGADAFTPTVQGPAGGDLGQGERPPLRLRGPLPVDAARNHRLFLRAMASALHRQGGGRGHARPRHRHARGVLRPGGRPGATCRRRRATRGAASVRAELLPHLCHHDAGTRRRNRPTRRRTRAARRSDPVPGTR